MGTYSSLGDFDLEDIEGAIIDVHAQLAKLPQAHANLLNHFKGVANAKDEEAFELFLADENLRSSFYKLLAEFARLLATALSTADWVNDPKNFKQIDIYKADLKRFPEVANRGSQAVS